MTSPDWKYEEAFSNRHLGPDRSEQQRMLEALGLDSMEALIAQAVPEVIRTGRPLELGPRRTEQEALEVLAALAGKNRVTRSFIGAGYSDTFTPAVIKRNILENPGWYTAYTPYQAEIAQGRLEALLNFQTMVCDLTGMEIANASLLAEGTAAAEAMSMLFSVRSRDQKKTGSNKVFVSDLVLPQTISILKSHAVPPRIELHIAAYENCDFSSDYFGALLQYPGKFGAVYNYQEFVAKANSNDIKVAVAADILSLVSLIPPGE